MHTAKGNPSYEKNVLMTCTYAKSLQKKAVYTLSIGYYYILVTAPWPFFVHF